MKRIYTVFFVLLAWVGMAEVARAQCPAPADFSISSTKDATCFGGSDGEIVVKAKAGVNTSLYNFLLRDLLAPGIPIVTDPLGPVTVTIVGNTVTFNNLSASSYIMQVTRKSPTCNINVFSGVPIGEPAELLLSIASQTNITGCFGDSTGVFAIAATGGNGGFEYSLDNGANYQVSNAFAGLGAGTHTVTVKDSKGCTNTIDVALTQPPVLQLAVGAQANPACAGNANGSITVTATGGQPAYEYSVDNGATYNPSNVFAGLAGGTYNLAVRDSKGCVTKLNSITLTEPPALQIAFNSQLDILGCFGDATGGIKVTATGGVGTYTYSKDGIAFTANGGGFTGLAAGMYTITVKDANGCTISLAPVTLAQPAQLTLALAFQTNIANCFGDKTGGITVTATGGQPAYEYSIDNGTTYQATAAFAGLASGNYTISVRDTKGCTATVANITLTQPTAVAASLASQNPLCKGNNNGSVTITATGGTAPYAYVLNGGASQASNVFTGLVAGTYTIKVVDGNNCEITLPAITLTEPDLLAVTISAQKNIETCAGDANGEITVTATGGTAAYQYSINNGATFQASPVFAGLLAGNYTILVRDAQNCTVSSVPVTLAEPPALSLTLGSQTDIANCFGDATGTITVSATGGTAPYAFSRDGSLFQTTGNFTGLAAGSYIITVRDSKNCVKTVAVTLSQPTQLAASLAAKKDIDCFGAATGEISVGASGGTAPYTYSKDGTNFQASNAFAGLTAGNYTITIRDSKNCEVTVPGISLGQAPQLTASVTAQKDISCNGGTDGAITISVTGGIAPYVFSTDNATFTANGGNFTGLAAGTYIIVVRDANGCTATLNPVTLSAPAALQATATATDAGCSGTATGSLTVTVSGGTAPYAYVVNGGSPQASNVFAGLASGNYTVLVTDGKGCTATLSNVSVGQPAALALVVSATDVTCNGASDGTAAVSVSGGTAPYGYAWNTTPKQFSASATGLPSGTYTVTVTDAKGCVQTASVSVAQPAVLVAPVVTSPAPICVGGTVPQLTATGTNIQWYGDATLTTLLGTGNSFTPSVNNAIAGNSIFYATQTSGVCKSPATAVTVTVNPAPAMPNISGSLGICAGGNTVLTSSTASGNQWFLNGNPVSGATGQTLTVSAAGSYTVQVTENGCTALSSPASVTQTIVAVPTISGNPTFCTASSTLLTSSALTGNQWLLNGNPVAGATNRTLTVTAAGSYSVTVAENGCSATSATVNVTESNAPAPVAANPAPICVGGTVPQLTASGSAIQWYSDAALTNPVGTGNAFTPSINNAIAGNSIFYVTQTVSNCQSPATQVTVAINPVPKAPTLSGILVFCAGGGTTLTSNAATGNQWLLNGNPIGGATGQTLAVTVAGNYSATVTSGNCTATSAPVAVKQSDLAATVAASNPNCTDPNSGALTVSASGGAAPYGYSLDGADFSNTTGVFGALAANNYTIYVKDATGCVVTRTQGLSAIPGITAATLAPANESGCAKADGSVTVSGIAGAGGPYQYFINGTPNPAGINSNVFGGLVANTYSIRIVAANGCDLTQTVAVGTDCITCKLTASVASQTNPTCKGNDGTITLTSANGIGTVSYSIDGGMNFNTAPVFANLAAGDYILVAKDGNGCVVNAGTVTLTPPVAIAAMVSGSSPTTCNVTDGTITVASVTGGKAPYQYSLDGVNYQTASTFSGLAGNNYTVSVRDADGCVNTFSQTITAPNGISTVTVNTVSESGCLTFDGAVSVNAVGGKTPYKYYLNGTPNPAGINNNVFSGLEGKVYAIRVETADGCFFTTTAAVGTNCTTPCTLAATVTNTGLACNNANNSQITVAASGGTGLYEYSLDGIAFRTGAIFNGLAAGNYTVTIRDRNNPACKITRNATITNPPAITGLVTATNNPSCQNNDGGLTVTASGGTGALQYALNGGTYTNSLTFNGLTAGTYTVTAKDANNCVQAIGTATLTAPAAIMGTATGSNPTTCAAKDGQITVGNVLNGTAPYQYSIDGATFQASATLTGLGEGVYQVTVKDANGCTAMLPGVTLKVNVTITATLVPANPSSCTTTDGSITINNAAGGTAPYQYSLDGGPFQSGNIFVNLADKKTPYTLTIRDANGCTAVLSVSLTAPNSITAISISATDETSCNVKDGSITVGSVAGGAAPYQYFINGVLNPAGANSNVFGNLAGGSYTVRVVTADGCDFTAAASVKPACCLQAVVAATKQPGCAGNDGSITLSATNGVGAVQYSINGGIGFSASGIFMGLASGNYTILVKDSICQKDLGTVTLTGVPLAATLAGTNPSGCLAANGTITISNVTGGTAPYQYSIDGVNYAANATFANLSGGNYTVFLKDASGCIIDFTQILAPMGGILSVETVTVSESGCNSKDGQITVTNVTGTAGPYQYFVDGVLNPAGGGNNVFTGLASGPHQVRVVAANGCDFLANAVVGSNCVADCKAIATVTAQTNPTCAGSDGSITVGLSGGTGTVTYSIDGGTTFVTTNVFTGLASGNYTILVRYGAGCQTSVPATLTLPAVITATVSGTNPTGCGLQDGVITISNALGGTAPYRYSLDGASFRSRTTYTGLTSGVYTVYVRDANGCVFTFSQTLSVSGGITSLAVNAQAESRCNLADGSITVANVVGAAGPYEYYLDGAANPAGLNSNVFANLPPADYTIKVIAANACEFTQMVKVAGPNCPPCTLAANTNKTDPDCSAPNSGGINVLVSGGTQPYEYSFNGAAFAAGDGKFTSLVAGDYTVSVRDFSGCVLALPTVRLLSIAPVSDAVVKITNPSGCNSNDGAVTIDNVSGGTPSYQYSMDGVNYQSANQFNGLGAGTYMAYVRDARGCVLTKTFALKSPAGITLTATVADESACNVNDGRVTVSVANASGSVEYYLNGTPNPAGINNNVFAGLAPGSYAIRVRDASGCEFTNAVAIKTFACPACALVISTSGTNPTSCALNNGAITTTVTSGTAPYAFSLDGTDFTNTTGRFTGLPGGSYTVYVKDATGCLVTQPQTLSAPSGITATTLTATVETGCNKADGTITVGSVTGGIAPYQYFIDGTLNPAGANSNVFAGLLPKSYSVRVVDANNCAFANTVSVGTACTVNCTLAATATGTNITSCTVTDGTIAVTATGGTAPYQYSKDGGATYQAAANFTGLAAGSYNVFVKDAGNCVVNRTVALTAPIGLTATAAINDETACKANDGKITVIASGTAGAVEYYLNGTPNPAGIGSNVFANLAPGSYAIRVRDASGCEFAGTAAVAASACPSCTLAATATGTNPASCTVTDGTIAVTATGGTAPYQYSKDGGATYQAAASFTGLAAGSYNVFVKDAGNCIVNQVIVLAAPGGLAATANTTDEAACKANDGKITVTATGGMAPYKYYLNGTLNPAGNVFGSLVPNTYTIRVTDANNCEFTTTATVKTFACPPPTCTITAQAFSNPVLCNGVSDGTAILINISGGSGAYEFSIDNGATYQTNPQFNSLAAGNYTILARDKNNVTCTAPFAVTIATKFDVAGIIIVNQPKTCGDKGKITFTNVFGGQAPYQFSVNGTTFGTDTVFADLLPGKYQATIRDAKNCRFSAEIAIIGGQAITATVAQGQPASCRQADGTITIANASGGSGVFVYSLDGTTFSGNTTFDKLAAGAYTVYVKEQNGSCVATFAVNVRATDCCKLTLNPALTQPTACTSVDGRITLAMTDGLAPFTYRLNNGVPQNSNVFGGLGNGNHTILVRDATGCEASVTVTLASPNAITAQVEQVTPASCFGKADGSVRVVSVGGGSGSYEYSMDGAAYQNSPLFANLKANIYVLYVRDKASGCLVSYPVTVNEATQITATVTPTNATVCAAKDGSIRIANVAGGVGPYQYSLDSLANYQTTNQFNGLGNRTYKVYIKDTRGCMAVYAARVNSPNAISVGTPVLLNPTCQGSNNGEIRTGTITGGQAPYQYSLNNGAYQSAGIFTALPAGNYTLKIKDQSGCEYPFEYTLTEPAAIAFDVRQTRTPTCADPTGSVEVINIVGGIPPYKYSLDGVDFQNSPVFGSLNPGDYIMYVRDVSKNTCASTKPFTIRGAKRVAFEVKAVSIGCSNTDKGSIAVYRITGGIETGSPVEYGISINGGNTFRYISSDSTFFANLDAGIYDIVIEYGTNCKTAAQRVFINAGAIPFSVNTTPATCGAANGSATVDIANPVPGKVYYYSMDNLNYFTTPGFPSLRSGSYRMYVRENRQDTCANIKSFVVPGPDSVRYAIRRQDCNTVIVDSIRGGVAPYRISISGRAAITTGELFTSRYVFPNLQDGEYTMTVTDKEGCSTFPFNFRVGNRISYKVKTTPSVLEEPTGGLQIYDITGGQPPYEVSVDGQQWSRIKDRTIPIDTIITGLPVGLLKVYIRDANGCIKQLDAEVKELKFVVPNIFTPNGDGFNDTFFITKLPSGTFMTIVDRWGRVVLESRDYKNDWDGGTYPDGVYFYTIDIAGEQTYRGWVQVWRRAE